MSLARLTLTVEVASTVSFCCEWSTALIARTSVFVVARSPMLVSIVENKCSALGQGLRSVLVAPDVDGVWKRRRHRNPRVEVLISFGQRVAILVEDERCVGMYMDRIAGAADGIALREACIVASSACNALLAIDWKRLCVRRRGADGEDGSNEGLHF